ncbi:LPS export ABC transporter permease LptG [Geobacter sp. DSM 9736]|uniref:LPS export ABC transporter permease LptG n=1 Tax=Geobacter sp. DSM 9736 TaxID=1277350 RepID=UPI000B4FE33C|nr:LPS export ABC transporter permease LptG [Geobacter sp. DSM 9736]SNB46398.1 lipopolysaccharide export system permease protein [Geobacter sp. DSM 9736]
MTILNRLITATFLRIFTLCTGSFVAIYLVIDFLDRGGRFLRAGGAIHHISLYFLWKIPEIVSQILPLAVLMATLLTLGGLARNSELTAMRSSGISIVRVTAPVLLIAAILSIVNLVAGETLVPWSFDRTRYIEEVLIRKKSPTTFFRQQNIWHREENVILQARLFEPETSSLKGVTLWRLDAGMMPLERIDAKQAIRTQGRWVLTEAVGRKFSVEAVGTVKTDLLPVSLNLKPEDLKVLERRARDMGFLELRRYVDKLQKGGYDATRYIAQMHSRLSLPFACLVMGFLGIPFALRGGRTSGIALGVGVSLGIGFSYLMVNAVLLSFGQSGALPPLIAAWSANLLFTAAGIWLTMTVNR